MNLPTDLLLCIVQVDATTGRALHRADPHLMKLATREQRLAWYHRKDRKGQTWIETTNCCLRHNYADPDTFLGLLTVIRPVKSLRWYRFGKLHRDDDKPAVINSYGYRYWYQNGLQHRDGDRPAAVEKYYQRWYQNNLLHRDGDQPAVVDNRPQSPSKSWWRHGVHHRDGNLPAVVGDWGSTDTEYYEWHQNGKLCYFCYSDNDNE